MLKILATSTSHERPAVMMTVFTMDPRRRRKTIVGVMGLFLLIPVILLLASLSSLHRDPSLFTFLIGFFLAMLDVGILVARSSLQYRLITSPVGIEFVSSGFGLRTSWNHLVGSGQVSTGQVSVNGVLVRRAAVDLPGWMEVFADLQPILLILGAVGGRYIGRVDFDAMSTGIPLSLFDPEWQSGTTPLGRTIRQYAPQVFGQPRPPAPVPAPNTFPPSLRALAQPKRSWLKLILVIVGLLAQVAVLWLASQVRV